MLIVLYILCFSTIANYFVETNEVNNSDIDMGQLIIDVKDMMDNDLENQMNESNNVFDTFENSDNSYLINKEIYIMFNKLKKNFKDFKEEILEKIYTKAAENNRKHENLTNIIKEINLTNVNENKRYKDLGQRFTGFETELQSRDIKENEIHENLFKTLNEIQENTVRKENIEKSNYERLFVIFDEFKSQTLKNHMEEKNRYHQLFKDSKMELQDVRNELLNTKIELSNTKNELERVNQRFIGVEGAFTRTFEVKGSTTYYYPVAFELPWDHTEFKPATPLMYDIYRWLGEKAPDSFCRYPGDFHCMQFTLKLMSYGGIWGYGIKRAKVLLHHWKFNKGVAKIKIFQNQERRLFVWLRGGGVLYHIRSPIDLTHKITIYLNYSNVVAPADLSDPVNTPPVIVSPILLGGEDPNLVKTGHYDGWGF